MDQSEYRPPFLQWLLFHAVPAVVLLVVGSAAIFGIAILLKHEPTLKPAQKVLPVVEVVEVQPESTQIIVESQGTVEARTQSTLFAEVSGRVESVSPALYAGGFFKRGDTLATIDNTDYLANLASSKSRYADAQLAYAQEEAASAQAMEDWKAMGNQGQPSELVLRKPQLARAQANLEAAAAAVKSAERDLSRTTVKAPYDGRVQSKFIDVGQYANARTSQIASIYSIDTAEVRLGISLEDTRLIDLPEAYRNGTPSGPKPSVTITANYGGTDYHWEGVIDRSEGTVDPQTRLLTIVAQISDPYSKDPSSTRPPLKIGSFVTAKINGEQINNAYVIPRRALRENDTVFIVGQDRKLEIRSVSPYQKTNQIVILRNGLEPGEMLCLTPLQYVVNEMEVLLTTDEQPSQNQPPSADAESNEPASESL